MYDINKIVGVLRIFESVEMLKSEYSNIEYKQLTISTEQKKRKLLYREFCCRMQDILKVIDDSFKFDFFAKDLLEKYNMKYKYKIEKYDSYIEVEIKDILIDYRNYNTHPDSYKKCLEKRLKSKKKLEVIINEKIMNELFISLEKYINYLKEKFYKEIEIYKADNENPFIIIPSLIE